MTLQEAIAIKQSEVNTRHRDLSTPDYDGKEWAANEIENLEREIQAIKAGEFSKLAQCLHGVGRCFIAHKRFDSCLLRSVDCEFYYQPEIEQGVLIG